MDIELMEVNDMFGKYGKDRPIFSVDPVDEYLMDLGFGPMEVKNIRGRISGKLTVDMFSGEVEELSKRESYYQRCVQKYYDSA